MTGLRGLRRTWERLGRTDPLWAVLSRPDRRDGGWDPGEFFRTGATEVEGILARVRSRGLALPAGRALDFGCGVGRVTQPLCDHFAHVDGLDISRPMLAVAESRNRHPDRCHYHLNVSGDLRLFAAGRFGFVYSHLVLQHVPPRATRRYLPELVRVLAPDGLMLVDLPSHRLSGGALPGREGFAPARELSAGAYRARIAPQLPSLALEPGEAVRVPVVVENAGDGLWPSRGGRTGRCQVLLGNHWLDPAGRVVVLSDGRAALPVDLAPGARVELYLMVTAPVRPGAYVLCLDMVQEGVAWFEQRGSPTARIPARVGSPAGDAPVPSPSGPDAPRPARRSWLDGVPVPRSAAGILRAVRSGLGWHARVARNHWRDWRERRRALMQMNGVPRDEVVSLIEAAGGRVLEVEDAGLSHIGWQAYWYWIARGRD